VEVIVADGTDVLVENAVSVAITVCVRTGVSVEHPTIVVMLQIVTVRIKKLFKSFDVISLSILG
jgi:hypothetical protein